MNLLATGDMMGSPDFKERFRAEYFQLKIRVEGLEGMLEKYKEGTLSFAPICSYDLLKSQARVMRIYLEILEERAEKENVSLDD